MLKKITNNFLTVRDIDFDPSASEYNLRVAASKGICAGPVRVRPVRIPGPGSGSMVKHRQFQEIRHLVGNLAVCRKLATGNSQKIGHVTPACLFTLFGHGLV